MTDFPYDAFNNSFPALGSNLSVNKPYETCGSNVPMQSTSSTYTHGGFLPINAVNQVTAPGNLEESKWQGMGQRDEMDPSCLCPNDDILRQTLPECSQIADALKEVGVKMVTFLLSEAEVVTISNVEKTLPHTFLGLFNDFCNESPLRTSKARSEPMHHSISEISAHRETEDSAVRVCENPPSTRSGPLSLTPSFEDMVTEPAIEVLPLTSNTNIFADVNVKQEQMEDDLDSDIGGGDDFDSDATYIANEINEPKEVKKEEKEEVKKRKVAKKKVTKRILRKEKAPQKADQDTSISRHVISDEKYTLEEVKSCYVLMERLNYSKTRSRIHIKKTETPKKPKVPVYNEFRKDKRVRRKRCKYNHICPICHKRTNVRTVFHVNRCMAQHMKQQKAKAPISHEAFEKAAIKVKSHGHEDETVAVCVAENTTNNNEEESFVVETEGIDKDNNVAESPSQGKHNGQKLSEWEKKIQFLRGKSIDKSSAEDATSMVGYLDTDTAPKPDSKNNLATKNKKTGKRKGHRCSLCRATFEDIDLHNRHHLMGLTIQCSVVTCMEFFEDKESLSKHTLEKHPRIPKVYKNTYVRSSKKGKEECGICFKLILKDKMDEHLESHNEKNKTSAKENVKYICTHCQEEFSSMSSLKRHMLSQHNVKITFDCSICAEIFYNRNDLKSHFALHNYKKEKEKLVLTCPMCAETFTKQIDFNKHGDEQHPGEKLYQCLDCEMSFKRLPSLNDHTHKVHVRSRDKSCEICTKAFYSDEALDKHMKKTHNKAKYKCSQCSSIFTNKSSLEMHGNKHSGGKDHICATCGKGFYDKYGLQGHERIHDPEYRFPCPKCGKKLKRKSALKRHLLMHDGIKSYICSICGKALATSNSRKDHEMTHRGEKNHFCKVCNKAFMKAILVERHMVVHTGERNYSCDLCGKTFQQSGQVSQHKKKHHPEEYRKLKAAAGLQMTTVQEDQSNLSKETLDQVVKNELELSGGEPESIFSSELGGTSIAMDVSMGMDVSMF